MVGGKQASNVDRYTVVLLFGSRLARKLVRTASFQKHRDNGKISPWVRIYQVGHHRKATAIDFLLARVVEVVLLQFVPFLTHGDETARSVVDLYRVAIVYDMKGRGLVIELNHWQIQFRGCPNIDR